MPTQRLSMRRIKQLLTMHFGAGASTREIARELGIAPSTVREYLGRASAAGIGWPLAADVTDESLLARLFVNAGVRAGARFHAEPDWSALVRELKRPGVNLLVLWDEYRAIHPEGYAYSRSASCSANSSVVCRRRCANSMSLGTRRLSTTPADGCRSPIR